MGTPNRGEAVSKIAPSSSEFDNELQALGSVLGALSSLSEEGKAFVFRTAAERLKISVASPVSKEKEVAKEQSQNLAAGGTDSLSGVDPKQFLRTKKPQTELQRMACLAYYITHARGTAHFKTADLTAINTEAAGGKFSNPSATVRNATNQSHYFAPAGKGGAKQITAICEDFVRALPDQEAAKAAASQQRPARRKSAKKKTSK